MTPTKQSSKIEQSPHFQRIVELYREHQNALSKKTIFNTHIQPLERSERSEAGQSVFRSKKVRAKDIISPPIGKWLCQKQLD